MTELIVRPDRKVRIGPESSLLMLGSCFTTEVGTLLAGEGLDVCINPTGNVYNPLSAAKTLVNLAQGRRYVAEELIEVQGLWRSLDHHTRLAAPTPAEAIAKINASMATGGDALRRASHIIVTFGTAYVFERRGEIVCNCHKLPDREFTRRRLTVSEIVDAWQPLIDRFSDKRFIFTVSPIRHKADGLHGNQLSKATLLLAIDQFRGATYFPAYETLIDELRDYSWYASDEVHPSPEAVARVHAHFHAAFL